MGLSIDPDVEGQEQLPLHPHLKHKTSKMVSQNRTLHVGCGYMLQHVKITRKNSSMEKAVQLRHNTP